MKKLLCVAVSCLSLFLLASAPAFSGENCSSLGGTCRDACGHNEEQGIGAFVKKRHKRNKSLTSCVPGERQIQNRNGELETEDKGPGITPGPS